LIRYRRLGEVFEVRLQIPERIIRPLRVECGGRDADERVFGEVVLLAAVELRAELLELREARDRATTLLGLARHLAGRDGNRQAVVARRAEDPRRRAGARFDGCRPGGNRFVDDGRQLHVDRIAEENHLARHALLALLVGREVELAVTLDVTIVALDAERAVERVHEVQNDRARRVDGPDLQVGEPVRLWASTLRGGNNG